MTNASVLSARSAATKGKLPSKLTCHLLEILWNNMESPVPGSGMWRDRFIGPNKILREGELEIEGDARFEGLQFQAIITLGKLVPKKKATRAVA